MHPCGVGHVLPWESNPIFTRRRGGSKRGVMPRGSHPHGLRPTCRWLGAWVLAIGLVPGGPLCIHYFPDLSDNRLSGVGNSDHTRLHGMPTWISNVDGMSGYATGMTLSSTPPAHYTRARRCARGEPTWISIVDGMTGVCQNVPAIVFHPSTVGPVRSLASGCFWLDYVDEIVDVVKAQQTWLEALELWQGEQPMETLERPEPASGLACVASEAV